LSSDTTTHVRRSDREYHRHPDREPEREHHVEQRGVLRMTDQVEEDADREREQRDVDDVLTTKRDRSPGQNPCSLPAAMRLP